MTAESTPATEDPLQAALDEAEHLMEELELGTTDDEIPTTAPAAFSIDSDDEFDPLINNGSGENDEFHPLHDSFLKEPAPTTTPPSAATTPVAVPNSAVQPQAATVLNGQAIYPNNNNATTPPSPPTSTPSLDAFKAQTSRFASNLATMAQRGFTQVASHSSPFAAMEQAPIMSSAGLLGSSGGVPQPPPQVQPQMPPPALDLDNEQKATLVRTHVGELLPGERVIMFLSNLLYVSDSTGFTFSQATEPGTLWCGAMTFYRLILFGTHPSPTPIRPHNWNAACWPPSLEGPILQIPLASMDRIEKSVFATAGSSQMGLHIHGKDNGRQLRFTTASYQDTLRAHEALQNYAFPGRRNLGYLFAFESKREAVMASIVEDADGKKKVTLEPTRKRFDPAVEFPRQMAGGGAEQQQQPWKLWTSLNQTYQICQSYPSVLVGPATLDETQPEAVRLIRNCAAFRSGNRFPALTWMSGIDGASLWRCSQPKVGLQGNRSTADESFLQHIMDSAAAAANHTVRPNLSRSMLMQLTGSPDLQNWIPETSCRLKILDLRPRSAALGNRTGGYGYENTANYPGTTLQFCSIGNIHAVRDAYQKLSALVLAPTTNDMQWTAVVEDTKWQSQIRLILAAAWETAYWMHVHRLPVLLHCSHGWDRTSQVGLLAQLLLDPYYRTRAGFATLVEKDFLSFGHPFHTRCAHGEGRGGTSETTSGATAAGSMMDQTQTSPIFIQLLDCVFQIVQQYPECFEFNTKYVLLISEHLYSCRFGNFLCDTERERELVAGIRQRTHSLWDYLDSRDDTVNQSYSASRSEGVLLMPLPTFLRNVTLWTDRHCLHGPKPTIRWLPADAVRRPTDPALAQDQQSSLVTVQEMTAILTVPASQEEAPAEEETVKEEDFTIDEN